VQTLHLVGRWLQSKGRKGEVERAGLKRRALDGFISCSSGPEVLLAVERVLEGQ
jgi:hypothetical protein